MTQSSHQNQLRLQVFLSRQGVCSRRAAMSLVQEGHVKVNGKLQTEPSFPVDPNKDEIHVDGQKVKVEQYMYVVFHKPAGYVTTKAHHEGQKNIYHVLPVSYKKLLPVGRLDKDTEGLLLLTNDGDLAYALTHPKFNIDKVYLVRIKGQLKPYEQSKLEKGVVIEGHKTAPARITQVQSLKMDTELIITIHEGKKRQIRLMFDKVGHRVKYLKRLQQGCLKLGDLPKGQCRLLTDKEITQLKQLSK